MRDCESYLLSNFDFEARKYIASGATTYLAFIMEDYSGSKEIQEIPIAKEYLEVFTNDLPRLPSIEKQNSL